jgi:hypothetical protein
MWAIPLALGAALGFLIGFASPHVRTRVRSAVARTLLVVLITPVVVALPIVLFGYDLSNPTDADGLRLWMLWTGLLIGYVASAIASGKVGRGRD